MAWAKLDDNFHAHPKTYLVGLEGCGLFAKALSYCAHYLTDGFLPAEWVQQEATDDVAARLVAADMLQEVDGGYRVVDYHQGGSANRHAARRRAAPGFASRRAIAARVAMYGGRCWICRDAPYEHIDHVKPIAAGGSNWPANLRPACSSCNCRKSDLWPFDPAVLHGV